MVHLNELHEKYGEQGLTVVAVSKQDASTVQKFVDEFGAVYPTVCEKSDSMRSYGRNSYPSAFLINTNGRILWVGNPGSLSDGTIDEAFENTKILPDWPSTLKSVKKAFLKDKYADALAKVSKEIEKGKLEGEDATAAEGIQAWLDWYGSSALEGARKEAEEGKVYEAASTYEHVAAVFKKHDFAKEADAAMKELLSDKDRKLEYKAGEKLAKIMEEIKELKPKKALLKIKPLLGKKYRETAAGKKAAKVAEALEAELDR